MAGCHWIWSFPSGQGRWLKLSLDVYLSPGAGCRWIKHTISNQDRWLKVSLEVLVSSVTGWHWIQPILTGQGLWLKLSLNAFVSFHKRKSLVAQTYRISCFGGPAESSSQNSKYIRQNGCFNLIQNLLNFPRQKLRGYTSTIRRAVHWILPTFRINRFGGSSGRAIQTSNYFR